LTRKPPLFVIPKSTKVSHVRENAKAGKLQLSNHDQNRIADAFPRGSRRAGIPTL
jgi:diketogulonate reductase-like aldo/keto reductase